jgi:transcription termination/antitermination protein NusG
LEVQHTMPLDDGPSRDGPPEIDYANWHVISIRSGREMRVKAEIANLTSNQYHLFVPRRELFHRFNGTYQKVIRPLFPGYLFIYKRIESLLTDLRHSHLDGRVRPVMFDRRFAMVREPEMAFLMKITGPEGVVKASKIISNNNRTITIKNGPLKDMTGRILYINRKKRKAMLHVELMDRSVRVAVGVETVQPA